MTGSWPVLACFDRLWPGLARYGRIWASYGRVLTGIARSARYASTSLIILSAKRVEGSFKVPRPKVSSMTTSIDEDVEKSSLADQDDVGSGVSSSGQNKSRMYRDSIGSKTFDSDCQTTEERSARYASTSLSEVIWLFEIMRDSTEYDRCEGRVVSRRYSDDRDYRDSSEPLPRHGRDYSHSMTTSF
ncbi:hypothetical protein Tco_1257902 [Tanacetum coccineum]